MPSLLVVTYESSTGQYYFQKVGTAQISNAAITSGLIASGAIGWPHIAAGAILSGHIGSGQIASGHIDASYTANVGGTPADGSVTSAKIASGAVGGVHIANATITSSDIAVNTIGNIHILNQGILSSAIGANIIATPHIANQGILSASFGANVIATPHIANQGLLSSVFGVGAIGGAHIANQGLLSANFAVGVIGHTLVTDYGIISGKYASGSITEVALASGISIDIAETTQEPTYRAADIISAFLAVQFITSGYFGYTQAGNISSMPAIGLSLGNYASGAIGTFQYAGRVTNTAWNFSGYIGQMVFVGTSSEVTLMVSGLMVSGRCVQRLGKVAAAQSIHLSPDLVFAQIAE
jgi:hypothetical protein